MEDSLFSCNASIFSGYAIQCKPVTNLDSVRDAQWVKDSCAISFNTFGVWPEGADGTEVTSCARSHNGSVLAVSDDAGTVRLLRYPASAAKVHTQYSEYLCSVEIRVLPPGVI